jgi:hypothetical protein
MLVFSDMPLRFRSRLHSIQFRIKLFAFLIAEHHGCKSVKTDELEQFRPKKTPPSKKEGCL